MTRKIIPIACFVLAVLISGCQDNASSGTADEIKHSPIEANQSSEENKTANTAAPLDKNSPTVIAYYFHRTFRCPTCLAIEADAAGIIEDNFSQQLANGNLMWIPFNLDDSGGDKFEKDFDISVSTLVVAKIRDGKVTEFKKLEKVWQLVGDNQAFSKYVKSEIDEYLNDK